MERKDWNILLDKYLETHKMEVCEYEDLNEIQVALIQELKRSFARTKPKIINQVHHSIQNNDK